MRIGLFTDTYPPFINGVSTSVLMLKQGLEKLGHEVYVVTVNDESFSYKEEDGIVPMSEADRERLKADMAKFDKKLALDKERLDFERSKAKKDQELKARQISKQSKGGNK